MKSLSKIFAHYLKTVVLIIFLALGLNILLYSITMYQVVHASTYYETSNQSLVKTLTETDGNISMSEDGYSIMEQFYSWAMILNDQGEVIWEWQLPAHLNRTYTSVDIARFSKWYLDDYPITERVTDYGLLVIASPQNSLWKFNISESTVRVKTLWHMIPFILLANLFFCLFLALFMGYLFYRSLKVVAVGIEQLSQYQPIHLPEKGMTEMLARQLNRTSDLLVRQQRQLARRDNARTTWIAGVSHDIRTPLSLIIGYACDMKEDLSLPEEQRHKAKFIEQQSLQIKHLIEDLNLTSRLEYEMQPLRLTEFSPARLLRQMVTDFYNQGLPETHSIDLCVAPEVEQQTLSGDPALLSRAFRNLIQNSIRHNPVGCVVTITVQSKENCICFRIADNGCGIPKEVIQTLTSDIPATEKAPHIMGLRIAWQIVKAHGWNMEFTDARTIYISTVSQKNPDQ
jgi:signal transduction histidine kinase